MILKTILLIDDDSMQVELLSDALEDEGHTVYSFSCPQKAIIFFSSRYEDIDLVVTDYHLTSDITGLDLIQDFHELSLVPYILMSGRIEEVSERYTLNEVVRLGKPFALDVLLEAVCR